MRSVVIGFVQKFDDLCLWFGNWDRRAEDRTNLLKLAIELASGQNRTDPVLLPLGVVHFDGFLDELVHRLSLALLLGRRKRLQVDSAE